MQTIKIHCKYDKLIPIESFVTHEKNANKHPQKQIDLLARLIKFQGVRHPIIISNLSGKCVAGHGRYEALKLLDFKQIPVVYQDFDDVHQEIAFLVSDNKIQELAETDQDILNSLALDMPDDFDLDLLGIPDLELSLPDPDKEAIQDEVPEINFKTRSKLGDLYELGEHRLMCGDSTDKETVEKLMNGEKADMVFTDPPYNIDYSPEDRAIGGRARSQNKLGKIDNDKMSSDSFYDFLMGVNNSIKVACKDGAPIYQCAPIGMNNLQYLMAWRDAGFHYSDGLIWLKNNHSISRKDYHPKHEVIHYGWTKGSHSWYGDRNKFSVYECSREVVRDYQHPTQKPVQLPTHFIENSSIKDNNVLDLFGGSGSTLIACEKTNRKCFMMELDPHYVDVIVSRWCKYTGKNKVKLNGKETIWTIDETKN